MKFLKGLLLPALLLALPRIAAAADGPKVEETTFDTQLGNILYFDDSDVALLVEIQTGAVYRSDDAGLSWKEQKDIRTYGIMKNPFHNQVAIAIGETTHWITHDQGKTWDEFKIALPITALGSPVSWHAGDSKKIIFNTLERCSMKSCLGESWYTTDGFKTAPVSLHSQRRMCMWARSSDRFLADSNLHNDRVMCIVKGKFSDATKDFRLLMSDDYFKNEEEPSVDAGRTVSGMANMASVKGYFVAAAKSDHSSELALYVTDDTVTWHRAQFGESKIEEDAYTILESTNYSIQVDVVTARFSDVGSLYTSNSNGTYFTKNIDNTNRNRQGFVDFEKIANIQGIVLVNIVDNPNEVLAKKKLKSTISFDDGRTFDDLKTDDGKTLHLHSVTNLHNSGRVFSSPAPGIVMGVGNTGKYLGEYTDGDLYVSRDAGLTWFLGLQEAHKYEFGDQGSVLVAVYDEGETDKVMYSLNHGKKWSEVKLKNKIRFHELTTVPDSTSLKFLAYGSAVGKNSGRDFVMVHLDFSNMDVPKCGKGDFESWTVSMDGQGDESCVMGHKQTFQRRKDNAECFIGKDFEDPVPDFKPCACDEVRDYECDFNFRPEGKGKDKTCVPTAALEIPSGTCKDGKGTFKGPSGWRKIPGNQCQGSTKKDEEVDRECNEVPKQKTSKDPDSSKHDFEGSRFREYYYLERGSTSEDADETIVMLTDEREAWITHDHGKTWKKVVDEEIVAIYPHQYDNDRVYFLTATDKVYYSLKRGLATKDPHSFQAPQMPNTHQYQILQFHPDTSKADWIIWLGGEHCSRNDGECHTVASVSEKNGRDWKTLAPYVKKCAFVWREQGREVDEKLVFCEQYTDEDMNAPLELVASKDWFETRDVKFKSVVEFATMSEFIIVATKGEDGKSLKLDASLDGNTFADARFPPKFEVSHQTAYTVLDSSTHSVFLHVTVNPRDGQEYGSIIKSNSNGTSYVMSLSGVNRNTAGYVDFEKMQGIEGVALANIVANVKDVDGGSKKKIKSKITHNDGADWQLLKAPAKGSDDKSFDCNNNNPEKCSLHIHGYTERRDPRETYSSPTAVGVMMGIGNVGEFLGPVGETSTWITTDAGVNWKEVKKGNYAWEYGDQGSVIVIVNRAQATKHIYYSLDLGETWNQYDFIDHEITVESISTLPSDTSRNFLLWGKDAKKLVTVNLDFSVLPSLQKQCDLDDNNPTAGDYDLWSPQHPAQEQEDLPNAECLFGHVAEYHRKKKDAKCYNGRKIDHLHSMSKNCTCTRRDFECDYNFERMPGGECKLTAGLEPVNAQDVCKKKGVTEYWTITGYRKIPISTCTGGNDMSETGQLLPCPGYEKEFEKKHGISGFGIFLAVVIPFIVAGGAGWWVWKNWDGKFGRIRLGDASSRFEGGESPFIKYPVMAISGLVAVVAAIPMLVGSLWRAVSSRFGRGSGYGAVNGGFGGRTYTSRSSFARGRGDYAVVDPDEGELLGEESDEEV